MSEYAILRALAWLSVLTLTACQEGHVADNDDDAAPNILFIAVDDLRPELRCYGQDLIQSPHIDRLAAASTLFTRAYCNVPVCGASRASLMTGIHPNRHRFLNYYTRTSEDTPEATTLAEHFKRHNYHTVSLGKVLHDRDDAPQSWSEPAWRPDQSPGPTGRPNWRNYLLSENLAIAAENEDGRGPAWERAAVHDTAYFDGKIAQRAVEQLHSFRDLDQPFFLAVGFLKPHLPFNAPAKYFDLYDPAELPLATNAFMPQGAPEQAWHNSGELRNYAQVPSERVLPDAYARRLVHGYYACVSYTDALIGWLLDALEETGQASNTIIVLWGDHGWSLGEHTLWCKHSCFHNALRVPLIIHDPAKPVGQQSSALASLLDLYPTLCDLAALPTPAHVQGRSLAPILADPDSSVQQEIFCRWKRGESIQTDQYLYTRYHDAQGQPVAEMLYDHRTDPAENSNVAGESAYVEVRDRLRSQLEEHVHMVNGEEGDL